MRTLLQKNTRYLLTWLPVVLLTCCFIFYILMRLQAKHMQEKQLELKLLNVQTVFFATDGNVIESIPGEYDITKGPLHPSRIPGKIKDTSLFLPQVGKWLPFELMSSHFEWKGNNYKITAYVSSTEISHLIIKVFLTEAAILGLLLLSIVKLNRKSSRLLWKPFFSTLQQVNEFDVVRNQRVNLSAETGTAEFDELNTAFTDLIKKVNTAYYNQKQFVENASHEMQTPLAIIRSKLELLINQSELTEKAASQLADITEANDRLSQMNRTLLLLTKIENHQFPDTEAVDFSNLLCKDINSLKAHYDNSFPALTTDIVQGVTLNANHSLLEILVNNLINNAVEHNIPQGNLTVALTPEKLVIENTGLPLTQQAEELFERFKKGSHKARTTGLGLAMVKQICILYNYFVSYTYSNGLHKVEIIFK